MALALTATVTDPGRVVVLAVTGAGAGALTVTAHPATGAEYVVRTFWTPATGPTRSAFDGDAPFGVPITYTVSDGTATAPSAPVTVTSDSPILADSTAPQNALTVVVVDQLPNQWEARSVWWDVLGSRAPFASIAPLRFRNGDLVLYCQDAAERAAIVGLLSTGVPFTLRTPCGDAVDDVIGLPGSITEELVDPDDKTGPRTLTLTYQAIARELGPFLGDPTRTYATLLIDDATYTLLLADFTRYADVLSGVAG